jgi:hypothetical protein
MNKRLGVFSLTFDIIDCDPSLCSQLFKYLGAVPINMCVQHAGKKFVYQAISDLFDVVPEGEQIPSYFIIIERDDNGMPKFSLQKYYEHDHSFKNRH